ncbi:MAG: hypothetical protein EA370_15880 [Wenzhouxiangella sp.]|nr:MAG: hypothetical protein EA370_15880 [Wenzhouxiangella sp.]
MGCGAFGVIGNSDTNRALTLESTGNLKVNQNGTTTMKPLPFQLDAYRITALVSIALLLLALSDQARSQSCDCSCTRYAQLLESLPELSGQTNQFLDSCAGACAIAWTSCEAAHERDGSWQALVTEQETEQLDSSEEGHSLVKSEDPPDSFYLP